MSERKKRTYTGNPACHPKLIRAMKEEGILPAGAPQALVQEQPIQSQEEKQGPSDQPEAQAIEGDEGVAAPEEGAGQGIQGAADNDAAAGAGAALEDADAGAVVEDAAAGAVVEDAAAGAVVEDAAAGAGAVAEDAAAGVRAVAEDAAVGAGAVAPEAEEEEGLAVAGVELGPAYDTHRPPMEEEGMPAHLIEYVRQIDETYMRSTRHAAGELKPGQPLPVEPDAQPEQQPAPAVPLPQHDQQQPPAQPEEENDHPEEQPPAQPEQDDDDDDNL